MKLAVVGGGSTYTPELVSGLASASGGLIIDEIALIDPSAERLDVVGPFCARIMKAVGHSGQIRWTGDLDDGLDGAGGVVVQLRVGGQQARQRDESWPLEHGCLGQETTGAGGLAKALRTVPVVLDIAKQARRRADPSAWIVDFTNPVGIVTRALLDAGHRAIGLCNVAIAFQRYVADLMGVPADLVTLDHVGLNHLTWVRAVIVDGCDRLPDLLDTHGNQIADRAGVPLALIRQLGVVPSSYLRYFYFHTDEVSRQRTMPTRAEEVATVERGLLTAYADPKLDRKPALLGQRGGAHYSDAAVALLHSLAADHGDTQVVNARNAGSLDFLPDEAVVELPAAIAADGARPLRPAPLAASLRGLVAHVSAYEELALDAALRCGRQRVVAALLAHPLIGQFDLGRASRPVDRRKRALLALGRWAAMNDLPGVLAIDAGNSKTDVALVACDGTLLGNVRGPGLRPPVNAEATLRALGELVDQVQRQAGRHGQPAARHVSACVAKVDLPAEEERLAAALSARGWGVTAEVANDTFAVLRAGVNLSAGASIGDALWGVAVVCGTGINCAGVHPNGDTARFLALGDISGDWGGGVSWAGQRCGWRCEQKTAAASTPACGKPWRRCSVSDVCASWSLPSTKIRSPRPSWRNLLRSSWPLPARVTASPGPSWCARQTK
ncbi:MAG TPA: hypothetical protein VMU34_12235 [Mycobacterium sp.]|nr:hypothetical protein [Mycobacterium sp.]